MALIVRHDRLHGIPPAIIQVKEFHTPQPHCAPPPLDPIKIEAGNFIVFLETHTEHYKDFVRMILQDNVDQPHYLVINHLEQLAKTGSIEMMVLYKASTSYKYHWSLAEDSDGEQYPKVVKADTETHASFHRSWRTEYIKIGPKERQDSPTMNWYDPVLETFVVGKLLDISIFDKLVAGGIIEDYVVHALPNLEPENYMLPIGNTPYDLTSLAGF